MRLRTETGVHSFELAAGLILVVPILLYAIDYAVILYAGSYNNTCCTAAARAAASGPPTNYIGNSNPSTPAKRAIAVLTKMHQSTGVIHVDNNVQVAEVINSPVPSSSTSGGYGGPFLGTVTIKTRCDVNPPFNLPFVPQTFPIYTSQTYPWTWVMPSAYTLTGTPPTSNNGAYNSIATTWP